jgi:hypothetical protein
MGAVNGNLFVASFDAGNLKLSNTTDRVINIIEGISGDKKYGISRNAIFPKATRAISQLGPTSIFTLRES